MITPATRARISTDSIPSRPALVIALSAVCLLGACAHVPPTSRPESAEPADARPAAEDNPTVRFDNQAGVYVDVYLVAADHRQWRLARVMPGGRMTLRLPESELERIPGFVQLAVLADASLSLQVEREPRAVFTIAQPVSVLVSQGWAYSVNQGSSPQLLSMRLRP